ncbi:MAG: hypothetical protein MRY76_12770 [Pseudomonadales bacterium]|nr:hypothetical protein [Pseudomonadales bacterium]
MFIRISLIALTGLLLLGCNSGNRQPDSSQTFEPRVGSDGIKEFEIVITPVRPDTRGAGGGRQGRPPGGQGSGGGQGRGAEARPGGGGTPTIDVGELVVETLDQQGYCREGFEELERIRDAGQIIVRGRCNELASEEEKSRYRSFEMRPLS